MDISQLTLNELINLQKQIPIEIEKRKSEDIQKLRSELAALANARGFQLEDVVQATSAKASTRKTVKIKYRHPEQPQLTWTGRGKPPLWALAWKEKYGDLTGMLVS